MLSRYPIDKMGEGPRARKKARKDEEKASMAGMVFSAIGSLITFETDKATCWLSGNALERIIVNHGGSYVDNVTGDTSMFILGAVDRLVVMKGERAHKGQDIPVWEGTAKHANVQMQLKATGRVAALRFLSSASSHRQSPHLFFCMSRARRCCS
jgi:hypothetical protein